MKFFQESNFEKENKKRVRLLMTKLDKMTTKRNTASFLKNTYLKTVGKLKKDALTMHKNREKIQRIKFVIKLPFKNLFKNTKVIPLLDSKRARGRFEYQRDGACRPLENLYIGKKRTRNFPSQPNGLRKRRFQT